MAELPIPVASETWLVEQWMARLSSAVASMMGDAPAVTAGSKSEESPAGEDVVWWEQPFSVSAEARVWVGAPTVTWKTIGNEVLKSAGIDGADDANIKSTFVEILNQSLAGIAQALTTRFRGEITCDGGGGAKSPPENSLPVSITLGETQLTLYVASSKALVDLCERSTAARSTPEPASNSA